MVPLHINGNAMAGSVPFQQFVPIDVGVNIRVTPEVVVLVL